MAEFRENVLKIPEWPQLLEARSQSQTTWNRRHVFVVSIRKGNVNLRISLKAPSGLPR